MGIISDIFTDPPELVAGMKVKPGESLQLSLTEAELIGPERFVEQVEHDRASRLGMAPPRRRPRRVSKKLAARGFAAHVGGRFFTAAQVRSTKHSAPALAKWLGRPGLPTSSINLEIAAIQFSGAELAPIAPGLARCKSLQLWEFPTVSPAALSAVAEPAKSLARHITLVAKRLGIDAELYRRQLGCQITVFRQEKDDGAALSALEPAMHRILHRAVYSIAKAAHGWTDTKVVSRQTSYRPIERQNRHLRLA